ncbi:MAG: branched-chain amino acid transport system II carrier protein [Turicibacter sp.]|nr:branched-chain amino acid transport system II carrier protein [Turicibacter sp.]
MKKSFCKDSMVIGFALFAMFFGASNLLFPPFLGNTTGDQWLPALIGFLLTGVGLPLLGILACSRIEGSFEKMASRVGPRFAKIASAILILAIGPLIAIPRTASTTHEVGILTLFPQVPTGMTVCLFFAVCLFFVLKPTSIVDAIGKVLTPVLLVVLIAIIAKGIFVPIGEVAPVEVTQVFTSSFKEGYQTMDAVAAIIFATIIINSVKSKGYTDQKSASKVIIQSGIVAVTGLAIIYGGLMYLGAQTSSLTHETFSRSQLLMYVTKSVFGSLGAVFLSLIAILACLTTAIALLTASASFFTKLFNGRVSYAINAIILTIISLLMATNDVDSIVALAGPALDVIYPVVIVLIVLTLMGNLVKSDHVVAWTVYITLAISLLTTLASLFDVSGMISCLSYLPFYASGLGWLIPAIMTFVITMILVPNKK